MNRSELTLKVSNKVKNLPKADTEEAVQLLLGLITDSLSNKHRIEIRGFGAFSVRERSSRLARNPRDGSSIAIESKFHPYFRSSKLLRKELNN